MTKEQFKDVISKTYLYNWRPKSREDWLKRQIDFIECKSYQVPTCWLFHVAGSPTQLAGIILPYNQGYKMTISHANLSKTFYLNKELKRTTRLDLV